MKKLVVMVFAILIFVSCSREDRSILYEVQVVGESMDCKDSYLLQFNENPLGLTSHDHIYVETNLPEEFKISGMLLEVQVRKLNVSNSDEIKACTTLGPGYSGIFIISASPKN